VRLRSAALSQTASKRSANCSTTAHPHTNNPAGLPNRILVERFKYLIEALHDEHVEDAVKARILEDQSYFEELYKLA
jgi:hypothetical protein